MYKIFCVTCFSCLQLVFYLHENGLKFVSFILLSHTYNGFHLVLISNHKGRWNVLIIGLKSYEFCCTYLVEIAISLFVICFHLLFLCHSL